MKASVVAEEEALYYTRLDGKVLTTTATCTLFRTNRQHYQTTFVPNIEIEYTTVDPFFYDVNQTQVSYIGQSSNFTATIGYSEGNIRAEPQILINFLTGLASVTTIDVTIGDRTLSLAHSAIDGDAISFDSRNKDVSVNGTGGEDYTGQFPVLES